MSHLLARIRPIAYPLLTVGSVAAWGVALFLQHGLGMQPCSLCILQRWALTALLVSSALAWALTWSRKRTWAAAAPLAAAAAGVVVAGKHLWLQLSPHVAEGGGCGFGGEMLLENFPLTKALPALFAGSGDCATLPPVLGVPLPMWTLVFFLGAVTLLLSTVTRGTKHRL